MTDANDILLTQLTEQWAQARQSESHRATLTNFIFLFYAILQGFIVQRGFDFPSLALAVVIVFLGGFGSLASLKYYERFRLATCRMGRLMERLQELAPEANLKELEDAADRKHQKSYPRISRIRLHKLWIALHVGIIALGIINSLIILFGPPIVKQGQ